jgi:hypothetical protein
VVECINNNAKHVHLVKEFKFNYELNTQRTVEVFEAFRLFSILTIEHCDMSQDQFLGMISPLSQLQELNLNDIYIKNVFDNRLYNDDIQLPSSITRLMMKDIYLTDSPELFIQTINSHNNLVEFSSLSQSNYSYLKPFDKRYPSFSIFEFNNTKLESLKSLFAIFENNTQLISLKLTLKYVSSEIVNYISSYLTKLEELRFCEYNYIYIEANLRFSQPTKIKKLSLYRIIFNSCSLNSILLNCSLLEELNIYGITFLRPDSIKFKLSNPQKLKKLGINCDILSEGIVNSILLKCSQIKELSIVLPYKWKELIKSICDKFANLEILEISPRYGIFECFTNLNFLLASINPILLSQI